jgi:hypothetical protein
MARTSAILQTDTDRAPSVAQVALCLLAAVCVIAAIVGFRNRPGAAGLHTRGEADLARAEADLVNAAVTRLGPGPSAPPVAPPMLPSARPSSLPSTPSVMPSPVPAFPPVASTPALPPVPGSTSPRLSVPTNPAIPTQPQVSTGPAAPAQPSTPKPSVPIHRQLKNPQVMEAVMAARVLRESQDMLGAIDALKSADLREPNHPEILGEMALTYEAMLNKPRAETLWRQVYAMGESEAGGYYKLAASKIGTSSGSGGPSAPPRPVSLGPCLLNRDPIPNQGERISLSLPILATPGATIDPQKLNIYVTFYESVNNGERVEKVAPNRGTQNWSTLPVDWREPSGEIVEATCNVFTNAQGSKDKREFHGYAVKLFYEDLLAGEQAQPDSLRDGASKPAGPAGLDNALFPK